MQQPIAPNPNATNADAPKYDTQEASEFDPFMDGQEMFWSQPFYDTQQNSFGFYNEETQEFIPVPNQEQIPEQAITAAQAQNPALAEFLAEPSEQPKPVPPTLRQTLEGLMQHIPQPEPPEDRSEVLPCTQAYKIGESWFFQDAAFAKSFLCTVNATPRPWMLNGYLILPAKLISRIRSGPSNHQQSTQCLWVPAFPFADMNPFEMSKDELENAPK